MFFSYTAVYTKGRMIKTHESFGSPVLALASSNLPLLGCPFIWIQKKEGLLWRKVSVSQCISTGVFG